jgi:hypothetical protein
VVAIPSVDEDGTQSVSAAVEDGTQSIVESSDTASMTAASEAPSGQPLDPRANFMKQLALQLPMLVTVPECSLIAVKRSPTEISRIFEVIKDLCPTLFFTVSRKGITADSIDRTHTILVYLSFEREGFDLFYYRNEDSDEKQYMCLNTLQLSIGTRNSCASGIAGRNNVALTLFQSDNHPDHFGVYFCTQGKAGIKTARYVLRLQLPEQVIVPSRMQLCAALHLSSVSFRSALQSMRANGRIESVNIDFMFRTSNMETGAPNEDIQPIIVLSFHNAQEPCETSIDIVSFIVTLPHDVEQDANTQLLLRNAVWRDGCVPRMQDLRKVQENLYALPRVVYNKDMLTKISTCCNIDSRLCIYVSKEGALVLRYNIGVLGPVCFVVAENKSKAEDEPETYQSPPNSPDMYAPVCGVTNCASDSDDEWE